MPTVTIRAFVPTDQDAVRALFIAVNKALAPPAMRDAFDRYIDQSLAEEMDRIDAYYREHDGCFMIAEADGHFAGMFGLEASGPTAFELRRMYVAADQRRNGIGRIMLRHAEDLARSRGAVRLVLSTSELQPAALALYRASGFTETKEEIAETVTNKTVGGGLRRFHFEKAL